MLRTRIRQLVVFGLLALAMGWGLSSSALAAPFNVGDVFAAVSSGRVQHYNSSGVLIETLNTGQGGFTTGMAFDSNLNLLVTNFSNNTITRFDSNGAILPPNPFVTGGANNESIAFAADGSFFVGRAGANTIGHFAANGTALASITTTTENRGTDWVDLSADQSTLFYTSEGHDIFRVGTNGAAMTPFTTSLPGSNAYALRILGDGGVLVADTQSVIRLNSAGAITQIYAVGGGNGLFSLNLDPDGTSFWTGDFNTGNFFKVDIATGAILQTHNTGTGSQTLFGLTVAGEITQGAPVPEPASLTLAGLGALSLLGYGWRRRKTVVA